MRRNAHLLMSLSAAALMAGCPRPPSYIPTNQVQQPAGKEAFANVLSQYLQSQGSGPSLQLAFRNIGLSPNEVGAYEKTGTTDGKLDEAELRDALDTAAYANEELDRFFFKGPDTNQTLPVELLPSADKNGDRRITPNEWLYEVHYQWLVRLRKPGSYDPMFLRKVVMLWKRPDLTTTLDNLAPRLFNVIDNNLDRVVSGEELAAYSGINNEKTLIASQQGKADIIDPQGFGRLMQHSQATMIRNINEYFIKLDKLQVDGVVSKNELAAAVSAEPQGVAAFIQLPKETAGRLEFERAILKAAIDRAPVQKALIKWAWPEAIPEP